MKLTPSAKFDLLWRSLGGWGLVKEYKFVDGRRFRFDYYHLNGVAIELEGGVGQGAGIQDPPDSSTIWKNITSPHRWAS